MSQLYSQKSVFSLMPVVLVAFAMMACGKVSKANDEPGANISTLAAPQGRWIQEDCVETYVEGSPPTYSKGVMRFSADNTLFMSSHTFDDSDCTRARPVSDQELGVPFTLPTFETTDGSVALDLKWPPEYTYSQSFALARVKDGKLYFGLFKSATDRPKAIPEVEKGTTVFGSF